MDFVKLNNEQRQMLALMLHGRTYSTYIQTSQLVELISDGSTTYTDRGYGRLLRITVEVLGADLTATHG